MTKKLKTLEVGAYIYIEINVVLGGGDNSEGMGVNIIGGCRAFSTRERLSLLIAIFFLFLLHFFFLKKTEYYYLMTLSYKLIMMGGGQAKT